MLELFKKLSKNLGAMKVNGKNMVHLIGDKISNEIVELLVHECLTPAIPYDSKDIPAFETLLTSTDQFSEEMKVFNSTPFPLFGIILILIKR